ncbi:CDK2-associated and cullin domain-containing protein 1-like [Thrips palmi]|uniref:CDK2-associated and cullin domain-containing protein 1-like n=1 Tax=Thrips palmi TaxID=161013 RepID=A0A6P8YEQ7_THRPL|nr:CDK2-associated and cullin domain-containing protein 1-like [Thrips palmi]
MGEQCAMEVDSRQQDAESEYARDFWTPLNNTIEAFLHPSSQTSPISFQDTFTLVYKCVGEGHSDRLHSDLMQTVSKYLKNLHVELLQCLTSDNEATQGQGIIQMIHMFDCALSDYIKAVKGISASFSYLGKYFAQKKNYKTLEDELTLMFCSEIAEHFIHDILSCVERSPPFTLEPALLSRLFHNLQTVSREDYGALYSKLFARFVTDALPRMHEHDLDSHIAEVHELQAQMRRESDQFKLSSAEGGSERNPALKRPAEDCD